MDHTLMLILGERTPRRWLEKIHFIEQHGGMALLNAHPDYLRIGGNLNTYEAFLAEVSKRQGRWDALPREAARWWRVRAGGSDAVRGESEEMAGAAQLVRDEADLHLVDVKPGALDGIH